MKSVGKSSKQRPGAYGMPGWGWCSIRWPSLFPLVVRVMSMTQLLTWLGISSSGKHLLPTLPLPTLKLTCFLGQNVSRKFLETRLEKWVLCCCQGTQTQVVSVLPEKLWCCGKHPHSPRGITVGEQLSSGKLHGQVGHGAKQGDVFLGSSAGGPGICPTYLVTQ